MQVLGAAEAECVVKMLRVVGLFIPDTKVIGC